MCTQYAYIYIYILVYICTVYIYIYIHICTNKALSGIQGMFKRMHFMSGRKTFIAEGEKEKLFEQTI